MTKGDTDYGDKGDLQGPEVPSGADGEDLLIRAAVVHDVNQMLGIILGRAGQLRERASDAGQRQGLEAIIQAAGDAGLMLLRLTGDGPCDDPGVEMAIRPLVDHVRTSASLVQPPAGQGWATSAESAERSWRLEIDVAAALATSVPGAVVREVLNNLLLNALAALPEGGRIAISADDRSVSSIRLLVADDGCGIGADVRDRIFTAGFTTSGVVGRGVGLAGCRQLLRQYGADLQLAPDGGPGSIFVLDLPTAAAAPVDENPEPAEGVGSEIEATVLVVDDEPGLREMMADVLEAWGCQVSSFSSGEAALAEFAGERYDLVVIDQSLPGMNGQTLAARLRTIDPAVSTVLVSGWGNEQVLAGADPQVVDFTARKPLETERIRELVRLGAAMTGRRRRGH